MVSATARRVARAIVTSMVITLFACSAASRDSQHPGGLPAAALGRASTRADYPTHSPRLIIPFGKGGGADIWGRFVATKLGEQLGQSFVVENVPGHGDSGVARVDGPT
jgi:hypothetical protein